MFASLPGHSNTLNVFQLCLALLPVFATFSIVVAGWLEERRMATLILRRHEAPCQIEQRAA